MLGTHTEFKVFLRNLEKGKMNIFTFNVHKITNFAYSHSCFPNVGTFLSFFS